MEGHCSTGQSPQWAVVPMEEEDWCPCRQCDQYWKRCYGSTLALSLYCCAT